MTRQKTVTRLLPFDLSFHLTFNNMYAIMYIRR